MNICSCWYDDDNMLLGNLRSTTTYLHKVRFICSNNCGHFWSQGYTPVHLCQLLRHCTIWWLVPRYLVVQCFFFLNLSALFMVHFLMQNLYELFYILIFSSPWKEFNSNFLLLSSLEKKCVISDELCAIFWEFLHWHIFWTEKICSPSSYSWAFNRLQMWRSIALLKYDLQLHFIHFLPSYEIEMDIWANLKKK